MAKQLSSKAEERLRQVGILLLALSLPLILCKVLIDSALRLAAPNYVRRRSAERQALLNRIGQWQDEKLSYYRAMSYTELSNLPPLTKLSSPEEFRVYEFAVTRKVGDNGGVEIRVSLRKRFMLVLAFSSGPSFEMLQDGTIVPELSYETEN